jgi:CMP-N,N'-diacetyllegionaminic acid synthase
MIYAVIPFRQGSKRLKNKSMLNISGIPLVRHTIQQALLATDNIIVTTDYPIPELSKKIPELDNPNIMCHKRNPVPDNQTVNEYITQLIAAYDIKEDDSICLLQPTCPCREPMDIRNAITMYSTLRGSCLISVYKIGSAGKLYKSRDGKKGSSYTGLTATFQHEKPLYIRNSSIYIFKVRLLLTRNTIFAEETLLYEMPLHRSIDIDTKGEFDLAKLIIEGGLSGWSPHL